MRTGLNAADREIAWKLRQRLAQGVKIEDFLRESGFESEDSSGQGGPGSSP